MSSKVTFRLDQREKAKAKLRPWGIVAELAGLLAGVEVDEKESYAEYLARKYS
ncbi:MAG TPA: hypothetical protein VGG20_01575 [Thermoanaerobaculia bacterium]|jgi:hypothetical protein